MKVIRFKYYWNNPPKNYTGIVEYEEGTKMWFRNGLHHRNDGPAIEYSNGVKYWYIDGICFYDIDLYWFLVLTFIRNKKKIPDIYLK